MSLDEALPRRRVDTSKTPKSISREDVWMVARKSGATKAERVEQELVQNEVDRRMARSYGQGHVGGSVRVCQALRSERVAVHPKLAKLSFTDV